MAATNVRPVVSVRSSKGPEGAGDGVTVPDYDRARLEDVGFATAMTLSLLGNYSQTGHFGGPLACTPYTVTAHLVGPELGGLRYDYRRPKHPYCDKYMLAGGHNTPVNYALWMIMERRRPPGLPSQRPSSCG